MKVSVPWQQHIEAWQSSGLSQVGYCRQQGLNPKTFSARLSDYRNQPQKLETVLIPVHLDASAPTAVAVQLPQGHRVALSASVPADWVAELFRCLV